MAKKAVIAMIDAGKSPWHAVSGDFFSNRVAEASYSDSAA
jgi:hypothetical protein